MKRIKMVIVLAIFIFIAYTQSTTADYLDEESKSMNVAESLLQSTVIISVYGGGGSGFYISKDEIITNHHVVNNAKSVLIKKSNGTNCLADVIFTQNDPDLALIKTDCEGKPLTIADNVKVGQSVLTMGNPLDQHWYVSKGIVGRLIDGEILHDAITERGMSGGPVVNINGRLVGVSQGYAKDLPRMSIAIDTKTLSYFLNQAKQ